MVRELLLLTLVSLTCGRDLDLNNDRELFTSLWIEPATNPKLHVYLFNFTNPEEFLLGAKPKLIEVGPYVFSDNWEKDNIKWKNGDTRIKYKQLRYFKFLPRESNGRLRDFVTIPNVPLISALNSMKHASPFARRATGSVLKAINQTRFETKRVRQILFGYKNDLLKLGRNILKEKAWPHEEFGLFVGKNASADYTLDALTGLGNREDIGQIVAYNGKEKLTWWYGDKCNQVKGTDGFFFPPNLSKSSTVHIFNRDLCRSIPLKFEKDIVDTNGIPGYRFVPPNDVFSPTNPDNSCFCDGPCTNPAGVFNVSACQFGSPLLLSWPHFFQADPSLRQAVEGLRPNKEKHQLSIDIQPKLGNGLAGKVRSQLNIQMTKVDDSIDIAKGFRDIIIPIMWISDDLEKITDPKLIDSVKSRI